MVTHVLGDWFVTQHEPESLPRIGIDTLLQIQFFEGNRVLYRRCACLFNHREMKLVVGDPVIGDVENRAIFQKELRRVLSFVAHDIHRRLGRLRDVVNWTGTGDCKRAESPRPELLTVRPPTGIKSPEWVAKHKGRSVDENHRRPRPNRT